MLKLLPKALISVCLLLPGAYAPAAMQPLADDELSSQTGEGLALALEDIRVTWSPTSFFEFTGANVNGTNPLPYRRADVRWYALSYTGAVSGFGSTWSGFCTSGYLDLGCPMGGTIDYFAPHDNPLVLRVFDYTGVDYQGNSGVTRTVFEAVFPTAHTPYRFGFWGELNVGTTKAATSSTAGTGVDKLQVLNIWNNVQQGGTKIQLFQNADSGDPTFAMLYDNYFAADVRMSVAQTLLSPDTYGMVPEFDDTEGFYFNDFRVHVPTGQLHYQSLILDDEPAPKNGDFVIKVTQVPNQTNAYNDFYSRTIANDPTGGYNRAQQNALGSYSRTHGYFRFGDWAPTHSFAGYAPAAFNATNAPTNSDFDEVAGCIVDRGSCTKNTGALTTDGLFFAAVPGETFTVYNVTPNYMADGNTDPDVNGNRIAGGFGGATNARSVINLGDGRIEGMLIHTLVVTTLGAGP